MSEIIYRLPEWAFDEALKIAERIEYMAEEYWKKTKKNTILHSCDVRAFAYYIKGQAAELREYLCDQIADQVQYTLTVDGLAIAAIKGITPDRLVIDPITGELLDVSEIDPETGLKRE